MNRRGENHVVSGTDVIVENWERAGDRLLRPSLHSTEFSDHQFSASFRSEIEQNWKVADQN
jgi:hypothetical protein